MFWEKNKETKTVFEEGFQKLPEMFKDIYSFFIMFYFMYLEFVEKFVISTINIEIGFILNEEQKELVYRFLIDKIKNENIQNIDLMKLPNFDNILLLAYMNRNNSEPTQNNIARPEKIGIDPDYKTSFIQLLSKLYAIRNLDLPDDYLERFKESYKQYAIFNRNIIENSVKNYSKIPKDVAYNSAINNSKKLSKGSDLSISSSMMMIFMYMENKNMK